MIVGQFGIHILCSPPLSNYAVQRRRVAESEHVIWLKSSWKSVASQMNNVSFPLFLPFLCNVHFELLWFAEAWFLNSLPLLLCMWYDFDSHLLYFAQERKWGMRRRRKSCIDCWCVVLLLYVMHSDFPVASPLLFYVTRSDAQRDRSLPVSSSKRFSCRLDDYYRSPFLLSQQPAYIIRKNWRPEKKNSWK